MSEGLKREIEESTREGLLAIAELTKRRCMVLANDELRATLLALDHLKPFEDIISTVVAHVPSRCILIMFHGVPYHVHFHRRESYNPREACASVVMCSDLCEAANHHSVSLDTMATASSIKINTRDRPPPQHLAEFITFMDVLPDPRIQNIVEISMNERSE